MNAELYSPEIRCRTKSMISGSHEEMVPLTDKIFNNAILKAWLEDDEIQEITVCSTNLGVVKTFRKFFKEAT